MTKLLCWAHQSNMKMLSKINISLVIKIVLGSLLLGYFLNNFEINFQFDLLIEKQSKFNILIAIVFFMTSFFLKLVRLILLYDENSIVSRRDIFRSISFAHSISSFLSILLPFKLGDLYRVFALNSVIKGYTRTILIVVSERLLDILAIIFLFILVVMSTSNISILSELNLSLYFQYFIVICLFLLSIISSIYVFFDRYSKINPTFFPKIFKAIEFLYFHWKKFLENSKRTLIFSILISLGIWSLEILAFVILYSYWGFDINLIALISILALLSFSLPAGPAGFGAIQLAIYFASQTLGIDISPSDGEFYIMAIYIPGAILMLLFGFFIRWYCRNEER